MKRMISTVLLLAVCLSLFGCGAAGPAQTTAAPTTTAATEPPALTGPAALDGKKIIFIGNSYTYNGLCVFSKPDSVLSQNERLYDQGLFFQMCRQNGAECIVTNWTFGGHSTTQLFGGVCGKKGDCENENHQNYFIDPYFDYVCIQPYVESSYNGNLARHLKPVTDFFRKANPDVKFLLLVPHMAYDHGYKWVEGIDALDREDFIICNWGAMLHDIVQGNVQVPGATQEFLRSTFVVSTSEEDGHHQNLLAGYITTQMVYCAITGESAVGQDYSLCNNSSINERFDWLRFRDRYYTYDPTTNFVEVFESPEDMKGIQQLIDDYLAKYN